MIELHPHQFALLIPLFERSSYGALAAGTLVGAHPGRVFVDQLPEPRMGLVCTRVGYHFLTGQPSPQQAQQAADLFRTTLIPWQMENFQNGEFLLFFHPPAWQAGLFSALEPLHPLLIHKQRRTLPGAFNAPAARLPAGMRLCALTPALVNAQPELRETAGLFYGSVEGFIENGFGVALLDGEEAACVCRTVFGAGDEVEIDIHTAEPYRRRGLAYAAACAFIQACQARGLRPVWGCWPDNTPSVALAQKLGFERVQEQPVCLWEVEEENAAQPG